MAYIMLSCWNIDLSKYWNFKLVTCSNNDMFISIMMHILINKGLKYSILQK